ncbi:Chromosome partitioning ATPase [Candidatus Terasakiella magnetica]|uniref:Chromosome partitioning ATPase n=1 Tax=Candidatus Terasakiella magnetica TaxID=1867952 RepID=A0A1C3RD95_9PROT|nr:division plane positioning ATPase MipZ [Candidatus Terasakiella magnetica]SCA55218.1 Chromosome partitioning ATPase [Candidatus Terasakiella magnetica]
MAAHVIVLGNEKGGTGKSTAAMHIIVALLDQGLKVGSMDLDLRQGTLSRYLENRIHNERTLLIPNHIRIEKDDGTFRGSFQQLYDTQDVMVIDTPGHDTPLGAEVHSYADTLITPLNDSFIDLDVLAQVDGQTMKIKRPSHYAETVWKHRQMKAMSQNGAHVDWIVMRNRLSHLDARNKRDMEVLIGEFAKRMGCRVVSGFGERVIYRELFLKGLTMMDMSGDELSMSHIAARQEVRNLLEAMQLPCLQS